MRLTFLGLEEKEVERANRLRFGDERVGDLAPVYTVQRAVTSLKRWSGSSTASRCGRTLLCVACSATRGTSWARRSSRSGWARAPGGPSWCSAVDLGQPGHPIVQDPAPIAATRIALSAHPELHDRDTAAHRQWLAGGANGQWVHFTEDVEDSMRINQVRSGAVIISASGMCDGGRIQHHLRCNRSPPRMLDRVRRLPGRPHARPAHRR